VEGREMEDIRNVGLNKSGQFFIALEKVELNEKGSFLALIR
jgi:hypothetical protein